MNPDFWQGKRVFLTGHTGFKGTWLTAWMERMGARVTGYSLPADTDPAMFDLLAPWPGINSVIGDTRDRDALATAVASSDPEVVVHMAAQALVPRSYSEPIETFSTNVMGTVNLLDTLRTAASLRTVLVVTSDKVYEQSGIGRFVEDDPLGGSDPYSASKAMQELATASYAASYLEQRSVAVATARAGNVIGGGDWAADRLVPDFYRSRLTGSTLVLRNPNATRPWQHVLEPLSGYLTYLEHLTAGRGLPAALNFGPAGESLTVAALIERLAGMSGLSGDWSHDRSKTWPEHRELALDSTAATKALDWRPRLTIDAAVEWTAEWYVAQGHGEDARALTARQIDDYMKTAP